MSAFLEQAKQDFRQVAPIDLPVSFRFRNRTYGNASYSPGELGHDLIAGGIIEDLGTATLRYVGDDLPERLPEMDEPLSVFYNGHWIKYEVRSFLNGRATSVFTLMAPEKG